MLDERAIRTQIVRGTYMDNFSFLGMHQDGDDLHIRTFQPYAQTVSICNYKDHKILAVMEKTHHDGLFEARLAKTKPFLYTLQLTQDDHMWQKLDPYVFGSLLSEQDKWYFAEGRHTRSYQMLGAHCMTLQDGISGVRFAVWAPNAYRVSLVGEFNRWDGRMHVMRLHADIGVWEIFMPDLCEGTIYKYEILTEQGHMELKADPQGFFAEHPPKTASVVAKIDNFSWDDDDWMKNRSKNHQNDAPISIYEVHVGSWRRNPEQGGRSLTWHELAAELIPYVKELGFSHIELLPVTEYPFDGSWGYQPIGLFAPTSRFGSTEDFQHFVNEAHKAGIGIIMDWVPAHFPTDAHGLARFDGTCLYEHEDPRQGFHQDWNTLIYNYGRKEVINFLISNALFWLEKYHIDGLRVDAVASMLYLDYSREDGQWVANKFGGNENLEAIEFLKQLNEAVYLHHPGAMMIAEESTSWPGVSNPTYENGLGFGYKWNMGWLNDTLDYMSKNAIHRKYHHYDLTFSLIYAFSEKFILPISHDEVVHGKGSLIDKMPGDLWQKFANMRLFLAYMYGHPGKKLLFMGCELAQFDEWDHNSSLHWHLLDYPNHKAIQKLTKDLNLLYQKEPALHDGDAKGEGFRWIDCHDADQSVLSWRRIGNDGSEIVFIANFTPVLRTDYRIGMASQGAWKEILNTDSTYYEGGGNGNLGVIHTEDIPYHELSFSVTITIPPLAVIAFKRQ